MRLQPEPRRSARWAPPTCWWRLSLQRRPLSRELGDDAKRRRDEIRSHTYKKQCMGGPSMNGSYNGRHFTFRTLVDAACPETEVVHEINLIGPDALAVICSTAPILLELGVELKAVKARMEVGSAMVSYRVGVRDDAGLTNLLQRLSTIGGVRECTISSLAGRVAEAVDRGAVTIAEPTIARTGAIESQMRRGRPDKIRSKGPGTAK